MHQSGHAVMRSITMDGLSALQGVVSEEAPLSPLYSSLPDFQSFLGFAVLLFYSGLQMMIYWGRPAADSIFLHFTVNLRRYLAYWII